MKSSTNSFSFTLILFLLLGLITTLTACTTDDPATTITDVTEAKPTDTPDPPTHTPEPSSTPIPTVTAKPTNTPTPLPTETVTATLEPSQTPTTTSEPTQIPSATPVNTPKPTLTTEPTNPPPATTAPQPAAPPPTATAEAEVEEEFVTLYYISNPNDVLGTFPEKPFDADGLRSHMVNIQSSLNTMQANLDAAKGGDTAACSNYVGAYNNILYSGTFYKDIPGDWEEINFVYSISFIYALDRTRPAYLACVNGGDMGDFNYGLAYSAIGETLDVLNPAIVNAYAK
ncbi:MAG: hypothetical protein H6653_19320 [Ardenticatenaceae bacterium]|nr:hypothetical protein [Ardenticatenaceae bacterium]